MSPIESIQPLNDEDKERMKKFQDGRFGLYLNQAVEIATLIEPDILNGIDTGATVVLINESNEAVEKFRSNVRTKVVGLLDLDSRHFYTTVVPDESDPNKTYVHFSTSQLYPHQKGRN